MRDTFREFYGCPPENAELFWTEALVVLDTNVLLNLYAYPKNSRELWFRVLGELQNRGQLWMPHQVGLEYQRNRPLAMFGQKVVYDKLSANLTEIVKITDAMDSHGPHSVVDISKYVSEIRQLVDKQKRRIGEAQRKHSVKPLDDPIRDELDRLYAGCIGEPFDEQRLAELYESGEERYASSIPPGFGDREKAGDENAGCDFGVRREYGDLVLWQQIIDKATAEGCPIIFVTDDKNKGDWLWLTRKKGQNLGTHPLLRRELYAAAQQLLEIVQPNDFVAEAAERFDIEATPSVITEVQQVANKSRRIREAAVAHRYETAAAIERLDLAESNYRQMLIAKDRISAELSDLEQSMVSARNSDDLRRYTELRWEMERTKKQLEELQASILQSELNRRMTKRQYELLVSARESPFPEGEDHTQRWAYPAPD